MTRLTMLVVLDRHDEPSLQVLREALAEWYVIPCTVADLAAASRAFRFALVLVIGDVTITAELRSALDLLRTSCARVAFAADATRARRAVDRALNTLHG